jgi:hypothetical protein
MIHKGNKNSVKQFPHIRALISSIIGLKKVPITNSLTKKIIQEIGSIRDRSVLNKIWMGKYELVEDAIQGSEDSLISIRATINASGMLILRIGFVFDEGLNRGIVIVGSEKFLIELGETLFSGSRLLPVLNERRKTGVSIEIGSTELW